MKLHHFVFVLFLGILIPYQLISQELRENELVVIQGEKYLLHQVKIGETISSICRNYQIEDNDLLYHNPKLVNGLNAGEILKIPYTEDIEDLIISDPQKGAPTGFIIHEIQRRETPYFVAREYGIEIDEIYQYNPDLKKFKRGEEIRIPQWDSVDEPVQNDMESISEVGNSIISTESEMIIHQVQPGETAYSISRLYDRPISEIYRYNTEVNSPQDIKIGMILRLPKTRSEIPGQNDIQEGEYFIHMIETGETLYGITRKYNISEEELKEINPVLDTGFPAGVNLKIPANDQSQGSISQPVDTNNLTRHLVEKGETLTALSMKYGVKIIDIKKYNPALANRDGLLLGETIIIPETSTDLLEEEELPSTETSTDFSEIEELPLTYEDPFYKMIDYHSIKPEVVIPEQCNQDVNRSFFFQTYNVGLFLPLFLEANDTINKISRESIPKQDSILFIEDEFVDISEENEVDTLIDEVQSDLTYDFYWMTEDYLHFYEGVLLAVDSMQRKGMNVQLHIYDTERSRSKILQEMSKPSFLNLDLIIGPIYPEVQEPVSDFAYKNRIPMVSPLSSDNRFTNINPYYFQVNPSYKYILQQTAELISENYYDSNFIVLKVASDSETPDELLVELCHEKLFNSGYYSETNNLSFKIYELDKYGGIGLSRILTKNKENVFIIPSSNGINGEGQVFTALQNINNQSTGFPVTVFGTNKFHQYESIDLEYMHNLKLKYFYPYWVDYNDQTTQRFFKNFRKNFGTEPNNYSIQGYDVSLFFLNALWKYGKDFSDCIPYLNVDLIQGNYSFDKINATGGFMNYGISLISYDNKYNVSSPFKIAGR